MTQLLCDKCTRPGTKSLKIFKFGYTFKDSTTFEKATILNADVILDICEDCQTSFTDEFLKNLTANPIK